MPFERRLKNTKRRGGGGGGGLAHSPSCTYLIVISWFVHRACRTIDCPYYSESKVLRNWTAPKYRLRKRYKLRTHFSTIIYISVNGVSARRGWSSGNHVGPSNYNKMLVLKGKYHVNLVSFQNTKKFVCQQKPKKIVQFCYKLSPSAVKLSISAFGQRQSRSEWIET